MPRRFAPRLSTLIFRNVILGGEGGIRTHGGLSSSTVFKTVALNHSATSPKNKLYSCMLYHCAERVGFEPTRDFHPYLVSSEALSATQPPLHSRRSILGISRLVNNLFQFYIEKMEKTKRPGIKAL